MPTRIAALPRDKHGRPIPWFVATMADGSRDFRIADPGRWVQAARFGKCWVCGQPLGRWAAFCIGPMCAVNRVTSEPPAHRECALYSAQACPFLATPGMRRRPVAEELKGTVAGVMIERNPGAVLVWITRRWHLFKAPGGPLISLGDPEETLWFAHGRSATAAEAREAMATGLPILMQAAEADDDPAASRAAIERDYAAAQRLLPA